jgi:2-amino-4-hydroxy-6-hydroxymethyldihydropteridine diphosphokinase
MEAFIAIGSNVGDRAYFVRESIVAMNAIKDIDVTDTSSAYESKAHILPGQQAQHPYVNAVACLKTSIEPMELLAHCLTIERSLGRQRQHEGRWAARTLDLDILLYGDLSTTVDELTIPHPRLSERRFVLEPLFEIRPELHIPSPFDASVQYLLAMCTDTGPLDIIVSRSSLILSL